MDLEVIDGPLFMDFCRMEDDTLVDESFFAKSERQQFVAEKISKNQRAVFQFSAECSVSKQANSKPNMKPNQASNIKKTASIKSNVINAQGSRGLRLQPKVLEPQLNVRNAFKIQPQRNVNPISKTRPIAPRYQLEKKVKVPPVLKERMERKPIQKNISTKRAAPSAYVRPVKEHKKNTLPTTPECLKRSLNKANLNKAKTSEQMEMERIAQLQKEMSRHLKSNRAILKRVVKAPALKPVVLPSRREKIQPKEPIISNRPANNGGVIKKLQQKPFVRFTDINKNVMASAKAFDRFVKPKYTSTPLCSKTMPVISNINNFVPTAATASMKKMYPALDAKPTHAGLVIVRKPHQPTLTPAQRRVCRTQVKGDKPKANVPSAKMGCYVKVEKLVIKNEEKATSQPTSVTNNCCVKIKKLSIKDISKFQSKAPLSEKRSTRSSTRNSKPLAEVTASLENSLMLPATEGLSRRITRSAKKRILGSPFGIENEFPLLSS